ncbi:MAG: glycosyltransferase family 4 protein [Gemmatimonadales bacterium]|nr:glycosyltransferase family 4 protein [Gemmatimonadales bacterium]
MLLTYDFPPMGGGIARMMGELTRRYPAGSLQVSTGSHPGAEQSDAVYPNHIDRIAIPSRRLRAVPSLVRWSRRAESLARAERPDFVWCGNFKPAAYPAWWLSRRFGLPYGIFLYGTELLLLQSRIGRSAVKRRAARSLIERAGVLVAISRWTRDRCLATLAELGLDPGRVAVRTVPLGTDPVQFRPGIDPSAVRRRYGLEGGRWMLTVARLAAHKGFDTVLHALALLRDEAPELRYAVVGSGIMQRDLETMARELGVADRVRFLTEVADCDLPALYNSAEIYVGVSRQVELMVEGFGISLVEASACGIPVIGGASGGIPDAVRDGETGLLVESGRPEPVRDAVRRLLGDRELALRLGAGGRRAVESFYNWDRVAADVIQIGREFASR